MDRIGYWKNQVGINHNITMLVYSIGRNITEDEWELIVNYMDKKTTSYNKVINIKFPKYKNGKKGGIAERIKTYYNTLNIDVKDYTIQVDDFHIVHITRYMYIVFVLLLYITSDRDNKVVIQAEEILNYLLQKMYTVSNISNDEFKKILINYIPINEKADYYSEEIINTLLSLGED